MKIRIIVSIIMVSTILFLCSCGNNTEQTEPTSHNIANETISEQQESAQAAINNENTIEQSNNESEQKVEYTPVNFGETISLDFVDITIDGASYGTEIVPDGSDNYLHTHSEDEKFIYIYGTIKNTSSDSFNIYNMYTAMTFDDKYNYSAGISAYLDGSLAGADCYLTPLKSVKFYILTTVPDELIEEYNKMVVNFGFKSNFEFISSSTEKDECDNLFTITISK